MRSRCDGAGEKENEGHKAERKVESRKKELLGLEARRVCGDAHGQRTASSGPSTKFASPLSAAIAAAEV